MSVGIDLGTSGCRVGVWEHSNVTPILNEWDELSTPSFVRVEQNKHEIGSLAKAAANVNSKITVFGLKHLLGAEYREPGTQRLVQRWPFRVQEGAQGEPVIRIDPHVHSPESLLALVLGRLRADVVKHGVEVCASLHCSHLMRDAWSLTR